MKRLHWFTWAAMLLMAGALVACQVYEKIFVVGTASQGWPCYMRQTRPVTQWFVLPAVYNLVSCSILVFCTRFVVENWRRNHWQLRIGSLFRLTAVVAILLAWPKFPSWLRESTHFRPIPPWWLPWWLCLPLLIGLACTLYAIGWGIVWLLRRRRPGFWLLNAKPKGKSSN